MDSPGCRYFIENGCCYFMLLDSGRKFPVVPEESKNVCTRKHGRYGVNDSFATGERDKPVMDYRYPHVTQV